MAVAEFESRTAGIFVVAPKVFLSVPWFQNCQRARYLLAGQFAV